MKKGFYQDGLTAKKYTLAKARAYSGERNDIISIKMEGENEWTLH